MAISAQQVKELRDKTGAGIMDCRRALEDTNGDMEKASVALREKGLTKHTKVAGRATGQGLVESVHSHGRPHRRSRGDQLRNRLCRTHGRVPYSRSRDRHASGLDGPEDRGRRCRPSRATTKSVLLNQSYIRNPSVTIRDLIREAIGKVRENIVVSRFGRFEVGTSGGAQDDTGQENQ